VQLDQFSEFFPVDGLLRIINKRGNQRYKQNLSIISWYFSTPENGIDETASA